MNRRGESVSTGGEQAAGALGRPDQSRDPFAGPWFDAKTAAAYVPCASVKAWYMWRRRHGIIPRANGSVSKRDLDAALNLRRRAPRVMHPHSLQNLARRHAADGAAAVAPRHSNCLEVVR